MTTETADTFAGGLATRVPAELTLRQILRDVDDFATVPEAAIAEAIRDLLRFTHNLAEGAGAAPLAAIRDRRRGARREARGHGAVGREPRRGDATARVDRSALRSESSIGARGSMPSQQSAENA